MTEFTTPRRSWLESVRSFFHPRVLTMFILGFSAGVPNPVIFSSLSLWLREAGIDRSQVTFFSWAALGYSFKFIWAPLIDRLPIPFLTRIFGRRRGWLLLSQLSVAASIVFMAFVDPARGPESITLMFIGAILLGFSSATQDIVIDAYRIESADEALQALMASAYVAGYRIAMIFAGAGALFLADMMGSDAGAYRYMAWEITYCVMALGMLVGIAATLVIREPEKNSDGRGSMTVGYYLRFMALFILAVSGFVLTFFLSAKAVGILKDGLTGVFGSPHLSGFIVETLRFALAVFIAYAISELTIAMGFIPRDLVRETYVEPVANFFERYGLKLALLLLALIALYRISDSVMGIMTNVFYQDMGFTKTEIATISKTFGLGMTILGGFVGGILSLRFGIIRVMFFAAFFSSASCLLFMALANMGHSLPMLYVAISSDNLAGGVASAAFIAFLSSLTDIKFTAMQYAIFSSLMTLVPRIIGGYAGTMVDGLGYTVFFLITALLGIPVLVLVWLSGKYLLPLGEGREKS